MKIWIVNAKVETTTTAIVANKGLSISPQMHTTKLCQYDKHTYEGAATPVYNAQVIGCTFSSAGS